MQFGISINGDSPKTHNKLDKAVEAFLAELEDVEGISVNVTGWTHDRMSTRLFGRLPRKDAVELSPEAKAEVAKEAAAEDKKPAARKPRPKKAA